VQVEASPKAVPPRARSGLSRGKGKKKGKDKGQKKEAKAKNPAAKAKALAKAKEEAKEAADAARKQQVSRVEVNGSECPMAGAWNADGATCLHERRTRTDHRTSTGAEDYVEIPLHR